MMVNRRKNLVNETRCEMVMMIDERGRRKFDENHQEIFRLSLAIEASTRFVEENDNCRFRLVLNWRLV